MLAPSASVRRASNRMRMRTLCLAHTYVRTYASQCTSPARTTTHGGTGRSAATARVYGCKAVTRPTFGRAAQIARMVAESPNRPASEEDEKNGADR